MKTKLIKYIIMMFVLFPLLGFGQDYPCYYNTTTNPGAPYNVQITNGLVPSTYLSQWDWTEWDEQQQEMMYMFIDISSAYGDENSTVLNPFNRDNPDYSTRIPLNHDDRDFWPEDGWELINKNVGYWFNNTLIAPAPVLDEDVAYIMFYNRYTGTIRVFYTAYLDISGNQYSGVKVVLKFNDENLTGVSGLLRTAEKYDIALDKNTETLSIKTVSSAGNSSPNTWNMVEFFVGYDPCTCLFQSDLELLISYLDVVAFNADFRGIATEVPLDADGDGILDFKDDFLINVGDAPSGTYIFATMDKMLDAYIEKLEAIKVKNAEINASNVKVNRFLTIIKTYKTILTNGLNQVLGPLMLDVATYYHDCIVPGVFNGNIVEVDPIKVDQDAKKILGFGLDQLSSMITKGTIGPGIQPTLSAPSSPTATISESTMSGNLDGPSSNHYFTFYNPGTYGNVPGLQGALGSHYPAYNEVLGLFALLKTPQMERFGARVNSTETSIGFLENRWKEQYKLKDPLRFVFNPAADVDIANTKITMSIQIKGKFYVADDIEVEISSGGSVNYSSAIVNRELRPINLEVFDGDIDTKFILTSPFIDINAFNNLVTEFGIQFDADFLLWDQEEFITIITENDLLGFVGIENKEVLLKIKVDFAFNSLGHNGDQITTTQIFTYQIEDEDIVEVIDPWSNLVDLFEYPSVLHLEDYNLGPNMVEQFDTGGVPFTVEQVGNILFIRAFDQIDITGNIIVAPGYQLQIIAGNTINVSDNVELAPEIQLIIGDSWEDIWQTSPTPTIGASELNNFCNNNVSWGGYVANIPTRTEIEDDDSDDPDSEKNEELRFVVYPNPAMDFVNFHISSQGLVVDRVEVFDVEGRVVKVQLIDDSVDENSFVGKLDISGIESGLYFIKVTTDSDFLVKKFKKI